MFQQLRLALALIWASFAAVAAQSPEIGAVPQLRIEAAPEFAAARARVESFDRERLRGVMRLVGLADPGPPIRIFLAAEDSIWAHRMPASIAGFAVGADSFVVLFPLRSPAYPDDTLEDVLHHEVAHVLTARASGGRPLPIWFQEGLATRAERTWGIEDQTRLLRERAFVPDTSLAEIDDLFARDDGSRARAYALSGAFLRDLIDEHGVAAPGEIMRRVAAGAPFDSAFAQVTRQSVAEAERAFWDRHRFWSRWAPFLTSPSALWMVVTAIALVAIVRRRRKSAALRKRWADEGLD